MLTNVEWWGGHLKEFKSLTGSMMFDVFRIGSQGKFIPHLGLFNLLCLHLQVFLVEVCGNSVAGLRDIL
jgi:hypothetical protein